jgi:phosphoserine aminotransferase
MSASPEEIVIPDALKPADGRFGSGPSKVRPEAAQALADVAASWMGTSHRQAPVKDLVGSVRRGLTDLFGLPEGWEIVLGNGGTTAFWDAATFHLVEEHSQHLVFGEFSSKFAECVAAAPHLKDPQLIESATGTHPSAVAAGDVDLYALTHNETSTGVMMDLQRPASTGIVAVDATSGAGGLRWDPAQVDVYYFAPQKSFASDGGLWLAACSPAGVERIERLAASGRWCPAFLDLGIALDNSRKDQTYNTPALATLFLLDQQVQWFNAQGGLEWSAGRCDESAANLYSWADAREWASPFVANPAERSHVVGTIDIADGLDANVISKVLRTNGVVDTDSYRKLGRNQLRIGIYPAVDPDDVRALTACIDFVVEALAS